MQISQITNATPIRKVSFGNDLTERQHLIIAKFERFLDSSSQRTSLKKDTLVIQNQNETIIRQNEKIINQNDRILRALSYLAQSNASHLVFNPTAGKLAQIAQEVAEGKK